MTITQQQLLEFIDGRIEARAAEIVGTAVEKWEERLRGVEADLQVLLGNDKVLGENDVAFSREVGRLQECIDELFAITDPRINRPVPKAKVPVIEV